MRWTPNGMSGDVEDRRGGGFVKLGIGGTLLVGVLSLLFGRNLFTSLGSSDEGNPAAAPAAENADPKKVDEGAAFVSFVLDDVHELALAMPGATRYPDRELHRVLDDATHERARSATGSPPTRGPTSAPRPQARG